MICFGRGPPRPRCRPFTPAGVLTIIFPRWRYSFSRWRFFPVALFPRGRSRGRVVLRAGCSPSTLTKGLAIISWWRFSLGWRFSRLLASVVQSQRAGLHLGRVLCRWAWASTSWRPVLSIPLVGPGWYRCRGWCPFRRVDSQIYRWRSRPARAGGRPSPSSARARHGGLLAALILVDARGARLAALGWRVLAGVQAGRGVPRK